MIELREITSNSKCLENGVFIGKHELGYAIKDDLSSFVSFDCLKEFITSDLDLLRLAVSDARNSEHQSDLWLMIQYLVEHKLDLAINGIVYEFEAVKDVLKEFNI